MPSWPESTNFFSVPARSRKYPVLASGHDGRHLLRQRRGRRRIGLERRHDVHPVERVQMIEVDDVVLHHLGQEHDVADDLGILGNLDAERVLHRAHRGQRVHRGADAADALAERPGVARIAALAG